MQKRRPNIILITCDQLRAFEVGCYGNLVIRTPHLDRLAREGVRCATTVTNNPVCMAARSVLLSGQYNRTCTGGVSNVGSTSADGNFVMPEYPVAGRPHLPQQTLPEALQSVGYRTTAIGKWHINSWPQDIGFDHYLIPRVHHCHTSQLYCEDSGREFTAPGYSVEYEASRVEAFLDTQAFAAAPFFLYYNISPPHCPLNDAPSAYLTMYDPEAIPLRPNVDLAHPFPDTDYWYKVYRWDYRYYSLHLPYTDILPEGYGLRQLIAHYYGLTTWVDTMVGQVLARLDATGLAENTLVIFTSDHGDNLGSHGRPQKGGPMEEETRIPLLWRGPGCADNHVVNRQVCSLVDVMPTILALAGVSRPSHLHGQSLVPMLNGTQEHLEQDYTFIECPMGGAAIRTPDHLYYVPWDQTHYLADTPSHFFHIADDPYELRNLAGTDATDPIARELDTCLRQWDTATPWMTA